MGRWYNRTMSARDRVYRTEAVVVRRQNLGEADRLLTLYSFDHGKIKAIAKGIRRPQSRKAGHLEPFTQVALMLAKGRELDIITQAEAIELFPHLRQDLVLLSQAAYVVELLDRFTVERDRNRSLYRLLVNTLERLEAGADPDAVLRFYELRLLDLTGYKPELFRCVECELEVKPEDQYFSFSSGGILCPVCGPGRERARPISLAALKVLRHYQRNTFASASTVRIRAKTYREIESLMEDYLSFVLERKLNSPAFIRRVRRVIRDQPEPDTITE
ncbi:MAG: DNA repair protein RecO [Anaerolineales bacterium]|jgi:DNA repair protein RecO (recombination protein O)